MKITKKITEQVNWAAAGKIRKQYEERVMDDVWLSDFAFIRNQQDEALTAIFNEATTSTN